MQIFFGAFEILEPAYFPEKMRDKAIQRMPQDCKCQTGLVPSRAKFLFNLAKGKMLQSASEKLLLVGDRRRWRDADFWIAIRNSERVCERRAPTFWDVDLANTRFVTVHFYRHSYPLSICSDAPGIMRGL